MKRSCVLMVGFGSVVDFRKRFISLLSYKFREFASVSALSILEAASAGDLSLDNRQGTSYPSAHLMEQDHSSDLFRFRLALVASEVRELFSPFDLKRLDSYANNMLDYHVILDLLPTLASLYFSQRFPADVKLSGVQSSILLALGLQRKPVEDIEVRTVPFVFFGLPWMCACTYLSLFF